MSSQREKCACALPNQPLQQPSGSPVRSDVGSCRDASGYARGSSRP
jgi:hypothetical protein